MIEVLNVTKSTAADVSEKLTVAADTEIKINVAREEFRPSQRLVLNNSFLIFQDFLKLVFHYFDVETCFSIFSRDSIAELRQCNAAVSFLSISLSVQHTMLLYQKLNRSSTD